MKSFFLIFITLYLYSGCSSRVNPSLSRDKNLLSCSQEAKPKSLQFLEQQFRCLIKK
jgi:uncharacterized protein YcfL